MRTKKLLWMKLGLLIVLLFILLSIAMGLITGNGIELFHVSFGSSFDGEKIEVGETYSFDDIDEIIIEGVALDTEIVEGDVENISVTQEDEPSEQVFQEFKVSGKTLIIGEDYPNFMVGANVYHSGSLKIEIPQGMILKYDLNTVSGALMLNVNNASEVQVDSVSADVKLYANGEQLKVNSVSGDVYSYGSFINSDIDGVSGGYYLTADENCENINKDTVSGDVNLRLIDVTEIDIDDESVSGDVSVNYDGVNLSSDANLSIDSDGVSGDINIADW